MAITEDVTRSQYISLFSRWNFRRTWHAVTKKDAAAPAIVILIKSFISWYILVGYRYTDEFCCTTAPIWVSISSLNVQSCATQHIKWTITRVRSKHLQPPPSSQVSFWEMFKYQSTTIEKQINLRMISLLISSLHFLPHDISQMCPKWA